MGSGRWKCAEPRSRCRVAGSNHDPRQPVGQRAGGGGGNNRPGGDIGDGSLNGGSGHDIIDSGTGADILSGGDGRDPLVGDDGNDPLGGDGGADTPDGSAGADEMTGAAGADTFVFRATGDSGTTRATRDRIIGFQSMPPLFRRSGTRPPEVSARPRRSDRGPSPCPDTAVPSSPDDDPPWCSDPQASRLSLWEARTGNPRTRASRYSAGAPHRRQTATSAPRFCAGGKRRPGSGPGRGNVDGLQTRVSTAATYRFSPTQAPFRPDDRTQASTKATPCNPSAMPGKVPSAVPPSRRATIARATSA